MLGLTDSQAAVAGLSFAVGYGEFFNVVSALNSSPWTAENFGGDPEKARSAREYVWHAIINGNLAMGIGSYVSKSPWLLIGSASASAYCWWLYRRALNRAQESGSSGWGPGTPAAARTALRWDAAR